MSVVADRFIELSVIERYRRLTKTERQQKMECLKYLEKRQWGLAKLYNFSLMAYETKDTEWHHEVAREIEKIKGE